MQLHTAVAYSVEPTQNKRAKLIIFIVIVKVKLTTEVCKGLG